MCLMCIGYVVQNLCSNLVKAYHNGRHYPNYLWITMNWLERDWWTTIPQEYLDNVNCTAAEIQQVLNVSLMLFPLPSNQKALTKTATEVGFTFILVMWTSGGTYIMCTYRCHGSQQNILRQTLWKIMQWMPSWLCLYPSTTPYAQQERPVMIATVAACSRVIPH